MNDEPKILWQGSASDFLSPTAGARISVCDAPSDADRSAVDELRAELDARAAVNELPLLADDRKLIDHQTRFLRRDLRIKALLMYQRAFSRGMNRCTRPAQKENAGRRRANQALRRWVARTVTRHQS